jgi:hypothetical protein
VKKKGGVEKLRGHEHDCDQRERHHAVQEGRGAREDHGRAGEGVLEHVAHEVPGRSPCPGEDWKAAAELVLKDAGVVVRAMPFVHGANILSHVLSQVRPDNHGLQSPPI